MSIALLLLIVFPCALSSYIDPAHMRATYGETPSVAKRSAEVRKAAPFFNEVAVMPDFSFKQLTLDDFKDKYLVLFFYPLDFTFVCPSEIVAFSDRYEEFKKIGAEIVGVSVDSKYTHLAWMNTPRKEGGLGKLNIPLISDITKRMARDYGVLIEEDGTALRGLFIIRGDGIIRQITINDLPVGRSVDEILRLVQAFQYTDANGEVCPVNWKPGSATMLEDPVKKMEYFQKTFA